MARDTDNGKPHDAKPDHGLTASPDAPPLVDRRLVIAGGVAASIAGARLAFSLAPQNATSAASPVPAPRGSVAPPGVVPTAVPRSVSTAVQLVSPYDFGLVDGAPDSTAPLQAMLDAMMQNPGARALLPGGVLNVTNLTIDYSNFIAQPSSGPPYGFAGAHISGSSKRGTILNQIEGSTGDVLTIQGKIGISAGPANNNKISGLTLSNLEIQGAASGGNGLYLRSIVDSTFEELTISGCASGIYIARESFLSGVYDEYFYNNRFHHIKLLANRGWGVECSGTNAIAASFYDCEATTNAAGGYKLAPSGMILVHCLAVGNGTADSSGRGLHSVTNTNVASTNNGLTLVGCRFEGNSAPGGFEIEIESGYGHVITGPQVFATTGANIFGIGLKQVDSSKLVRNLVVTGGYFGGDGTTSTQRLATVGSAAVNALFDNLGVDPAQWVAGSAIGTLIDDQSGSLDVIDPSQVRTSASGIISMSPLTVDLPNASGTAGANIGVVTGGDGKQSLVIRFPSGDTQVIATEK